jgi:large repetitive protein
VVAGELQYSPNANASGEDSFSYRASDGSLGSAAASVEVTIDAMNDAPSASAQSLSLDEDGSKLITLAGADVDGDSLSFKLASLPIQGKLYRGDSTAPADEIPAVAAPHGAPTGT